MNLKNNDEKKAKREARQLWDEARAAFEHGDYKLAAELDTRIVNLLPDSDHAREAAQELEGLRIDRWVFFAGIGALVLYALAWWIALSSY